MEHGLRTTFIPVPPVVGAGLCCWTCVRLRRLSGLGEAVLLNDAWHWLQ